MASISQVALTGATGNLGAPVLKKLLEAGFKVTIITRQGSTSTASLPAHPNQTIKEVDYSSKESLTAAFTGVEAVVSTLGTAKAGDQDILIQAALASGTVTRFIPSDFGSDINHPDNKILPVYAGKVGTVRYLQEISAAHPQFTYTTIMNSAFLDWGLAHGIFANLKTHTATLWNGGDVPFSATLLSTVGEAVAAVLKNPEATANKELKISGAVVTQNKIIDMVKKLDGQEWNTTMKSTQQQEEESYAELKKPTPDFGKAMFGFLMPAMFGKDRGLFEPNDNDLLGIKVMSEAEVEETVKKALQG